MLSWCIGLTLVVSTSAALMFPPADTNTCYYGKSENYQGTVHQTVDGLECQRWDSQTPHAHGYTNASFTDGELPENYCRNAIGGEFEPWCYTTDPDTKWGFCGIKRCETVCDRALTPTNIITLEATPSAIYEQLTKLLTVNCSLHKGQSSEFKAVMSVIMSKAGEKENEPFRDVVVVTSHNPRTPEVKDVSHGGHVSGMLTNEEAFLSVQWRYPTRHTVGRYRCVAYGIDGNGHPVVSEGYATVTLKEEIADTLVNRLNELEAAQSELTDRLTTSEAKVQQLSRRLNMSETNLAKATTQLSQMQQSRQFELQSRLDKMFESSAVFNDRIYLLSRLIPTSLDKADFTCRLFGGFLAEIRTKAQYDFVYDFLITKGNLSKGQVLLGATDEVTEGVWTYVYSKDRVTYTEWKDGANGGRGSNCMMFTGLFSNGHHYNGMTTDACNGAGYLVRFLCEVEEPK